MQNDRQRIHVWKRQKEIIEEEIIDEKIIQEINKIKNGTVVLRWRSTSVAVEIEWLKSHFFDVLDGRKDKKQQRFEIKTKHRKPKKGRLQTNNEAEIEEMSY